MSKENFTGITMQKHQDRRLDYCTLSSDKTVKQESRQNNPERKKGRELFSISQSSPRYRTARKQTFTARTPYAEAVLEAYEILPEERYFASERKSVDLASEWTTAPSNVKSIVACFLM